MKKTIAALAALAIALLGVVAVPQSAMAAGTVTGTITDTSNVPIVGATVQFAVSNGANNHFTGAGGTFSAQQQAGTYRVSISAPGYATEYFDDTYLESNAASVVVADAATTTIDASLEAESTITGTITDYLNNPVAGAYVFIASENEGWGITNSTVALADGSYALGQLAPGNYKVFARTGGGDNLQDVWYTNGYSLPTATVINLPAFGSTAAADVQLAEGAEITGTVTDTIGDPVSVVVEATAADDVGGAGNSGSGTYNISGLYPTTYSVTTSDSTHFFDPAPAIAVTPVVGSPVTRDFIVTPRLPLENEFIDVTPPVSGPTSVEAGKTYTWVVDSNGDANVYAILYSSPVFLGAASRNQDNTATLTLTIPLATTGGVHKLTYSSYTTGGFGGTSRAYFDITVTPAALATTGPSTAMPGIAGLALLTMLVGGFAVFLQRRFARAAE